MTINTLKYFVAVAEVGNFSKVAAEMFVSQPTISRAIKDLEKELGVILLDRVSKNIKMTEAGNIYYFHAKKIIEELERLKTDLQELSVKTDGSLRIAYHHFDAPLADILLKSLQSITQKYPDISVSITDFGNTADLEDNLINKYDLAFAPEKYVKEMRRVAFEPLYADPLVAVLPVTNPLAPKKSLICADLADKEVLLAHTTDGELAHRRIIASFEKRGVPLKRLRYVPTHDHIFLEIMTGTSIGLMARSIMEAHDNKTSLSFRGMIITDCDMNFDVALAWRVDSPRVAKNILVEEIKSRLVSCSTGLYSQYSDSPHRLAPNGV
jgi:DNA-binding transcriptional LysR family regulator